MLRKEAYMLKRNEFKQLKENHNLALSLEGGGARGAYQIGALKALFEYGFTFRAVVGTSIGAINAAYIAQHDFDKIYDMWNTKSFQDLFGFDNQAMKQFLQGNVDIATVKYLSQKLGEAIKNGGIDTVYERKILEKDISEEKIRKSDILFGLVAMCLSDRNGEEVFMDEIPEGQLIDYIMASSNLPVFKRSMINDKKYLDGGAWDNCPVGMLEKKGFEDVIVIRAHKRVRIRGYKKILKRGNICIHMIEPIDTLPSILNFDHDNLQELLQMGYYDAKRYIENLEGFRYVIKPFTTAQMTVMLKQMDPILVTQILNMLKTKMAVGCHVHDLLVEKGLDLLVLKTRVKSVVGKKEAFIAILEEVALNKAVNRYQVYTLEELVQAVQAQRNSRSTKNVLDLFIQGIKVGGIE